jgi:hypothetical protein
VWAAVLAGLWGNTFHRSISRKRSAPSPIPSAPVLNDYDDDLEPFDYHDMVAKEVKKVESKLKKECPGDGKIHPDRIVE